MFGVVFFEKLGVLGKVYKEFQVRLYTLGKEIIGTDL